MRRTATAAGTARAAARTDGRAPAPHTGLRLTTPDGPRLRPGDRVALIAPSSPLSTERIDAALANVNALELVPVLGEHACEAAGYLAGSDGARAEDLNRALRDPSIRGIFALRGGYGVMRILERVDYAAFARDPKCVMGYSDLTALLNTLNQRCGIVTFHGPVVSATMSLAQRECVKRALFHGEFDASGAQAIVTGNASGILRGGNLSLIAALCGTPYAIDFRDAIVLIEDVDEAPYRIDRLLTQLLLAGAFERARGFAIGDVPAPYVIEERLASLGLPVVTGIDAGHIEEQAVLPIGGRATI